MADSKDELATNHVLRQEPHLCIDQFNIDGHVSSGLTTLRVELIEVLVELLNMSLVQIHAARHYSAV